MTSWVLEAVDDIWIVRCRLLDAVDGVAHAFSTRRAGGRSDFDLGSARDPSEEVRDRRSRFLAAAGINGFAPLILNQVHGTGFIRVTTGVAPVPSADGAYRVQGEPARLVPTVRTADCVPVVIAERDGRAVAAVHVGWRGTAAGAAAGAVSSLMREGIHPSRLSVALGPAIGKCCYEVGADVAAAVARSVGSEARSVRIPSQVSGRYYLDLITANRLQLETAGVSADSIAEAPWCTRCRSDLFFSYRRDGRTAGRMMAAIGHTEAGMRERA